MDESHEKTSTSSNLAGNRIDREDKPPTSTAPRFASFKPRQAIPTGDDSTNGLHKSSSGTADREGGRHVGDPQDTHGRHRHQKHGRKKRQEAGHPKLSAVRQKELSSRPVADDAGSGDLSPFIEDRKGDENNIRYSTPNQYAVPKYREAGRHGLLGLSRRFKTMPQLESGRRLITTEHLHLDERPGLRSSRRNLVKESGLMPVIPQENQDREDDIRRSYLPLSPHSGRKRRKLNGLPLSIKDPLESLQEDSNQYDPDNSTAGHDLGSLSASSDSEPPSASIAIAMDSARERHVQLSRLVDEHPADVEAWLALIQHQDLMIGEGIDGLNRASSNAQKRGLADVKLSMYEKALSRTKDKPLQFQLVHGRMTEGAKIWESQKLAKEWRSALKGYPNSLSLWVEYLNFRQTSFASFTYESCRDVFKDCLDIIATRPASPEVEHTRIYVFLRMTTFMREAGFSEHSHALWQAILEYCFFEPTEDQATSELFSFENFWDSEVPRLGEEGAQGWNMSQRVEMQPRSDPPLSQVTDGEPFETWTANEQQRMSDSILPARTLDQVDESDPYRVILFSDIQPFLFHLSGTEAHHHLLEAFLCFCGLPPLRSGLWSNELLSKDPLLNSAFPGPGQASLVDWLVSPECNTPYDCPLTSFLIDTGSLHAANEPWFNPWKDLPAVLSNKIRSNWIQRSLRQLLAACSKDELFAEYLLAFQSQIDVKEARKLGKSLLKQHSSIRLYNSFALLEWKAGNTEAAERVWSTALSMRSSFSEASQKDIILIWRSWTWALLDQRNFPKALRVCLAVLDENITLKDLRQPGLTYLESHPTTKLRAHQYLVSHLSQNLSLNNSDLSIHHLDVLAVLTYLNSNHTLPPSLTHYTTISSHPTITQSPSTLTHLHQSRARLLHLHAQTSPSGFRPSDITTPLAQSIHRFPTNTIFLSLYHFHTRRSLLTDRIRSAIPTLTLSPPLEPQPPSTPSIPAPASPIPPLFQIWTELHRPTFAGSTSHSIRAAFERAVSPPPSASILSSTLPHSPMLWTLYILWEVHVALQQQQQGTAPRRKHTHSEENMKQEHKKMAAAIAVLHRALRACPWCKGIYMLAFGIAELREGMRQAGALGAVYEMMVDRGLRVHVEL